MQQHIDPESESHPPNPPRLSKIKPLIFHPAKPSRLDEPDLHIFLKRSRNNEKKLEMSQPHWQSKLSHLNYFRKLIKILHKQNSLSELDYSSHSKQVFPNRYFFSKIRNLASSAPSKLKLKSSTSQSGFRPALKNLSSLKNLTHLNFELPYHAKEDPQAIKTLFFSLARLRKLRHLSIDVHHSKDGKKISSYIAHLSQLQSLKLRTGELPQFTSLLPNLPNLTKFSLHLYGNPAIPIEDFLAFYRGFQYTKALRDLTLDFGEYSCTKADPTDIEPLSEGLAMLSPLLQKLRLKFDYDPSDDGLLQIFEVIKRFTKLEILDLTLPYLSSKKKMMSSLSSALSELGSLSSLKIFFPSSDEYELAIVDTATALESLQNLASLQLSFPGEDNSKGENVQRFSSSLKQLKDLQNLDLYFYSRGSMPDLAFESLSEGLKELMGLKNLSLRFSNDQKFTNKGISAFCCAMKGLKSLTGLTFKLENKNIDENAVNEIAQMMHCMPQLSEVDFSFHRCAKIIEKENALESFFQTLKELKNIDKITLGLCSSQFNEQAVRDLELIKNVDAYFQPF